MLIINPFNEKDNVNNENSLEQWKMNLNILSKL